MTRWLKFNCVLDSPIHFAARYGIIEFIEILPEMLNEKDSQGKIPLHFAIENSQFEVMDYYFDKSENIDFNARDDLGHGPLEYAIKHGQIEIVEFYIDHNLVNFTSEYQDNRGVLHIASFYICA